MAGNGAAATGLAAAVLLVVAACGGAGSANTTVVTVTNIETVTSAQPAPATTGVSATALRSARFRMPSKNVGCIYGSGVLRCDILSGLVPEPSKPCELDWTGFVLETAGAAEPECAGDTVYDEGAPVLAYGDIWWSGKSILCHSLTTGLVCASNEGHGFTLARGGSRAY
jgi:hypothetical protein